MSQNLFAEKIKEYGDKKSKAGGELVDATAATKAELQAELDKVNDKNKYFCLLKRIISRLLRITAVALESI